MSGFAGAISLDGAPPDSQLLKRIAEQLVFRGPDATNVVAQPGAGFVFTFLRTGPAPQCPSQPCTLDGRVWLIGDIRLDGRNDLRLKLEQHGDQFDSETTDEELVLRAWRRWGESALPDLIGDYSFALWDSGARSLTCARDVIGARPFFYAQANGWLYFSNTLNAIRGSFAISDELDPHFIGDFLLQGSCSHLERTAFREISRLPAGFALQACGTGIRVQRFMSIPIKEPLWLKSDQDYMHLFRDLLQRAVADRLPRGNTAIYMSGGLDSTSVAAVSLGVAERSSAPISLRSYCIDCQPLFDDQEGLLARRAAEYLGIPIHIWSHASYRPFSNWSLGQPMTPEPSTEPYLPYLIEQDRRIGEHARVVFTGYGGDGILTGQSWPFLVDMLRRLRFDKVALLWSRYLRDKKRLPPLRAGFRSRLQRITRWVNTKRDYPEWLSPQFEKDFHLLERWRDLTRPMEKIHPWYPDCYSLWQGGYWGGILEVEDAAWTHAPLERRTPFLDLRLLGFLLTVPPVPLCIDKKLLRMIMQGILPDDIVRRPKTPLAGDQLEIQVKRREWEPLPLPTPSPATKNFVQWDMLSTSLKRASGSLLWRDSRPLLLNYWLKGIETAGAIE